MQTYCVTARPQPTGEHVVHRRQAECALLISGEDTVDLGQHEHCSGALRAALVVYDSVDGCPLCVPDCNDCLTEEAIIAALSAAIAAGFTGSVG